MTNTEENFWQKVLQLASDKFKSTVYNFFIADGKLISVDKSTHTVSIYLDAVAKQLFWETNMDEILRLASLEIYGTELNISYLSDISNFGELDKTCDKKASIALQILPLSDNTDRIAVIDKVIKFLQAQPVTQVVTPFETVLEGEWETLFSILKTAIEIAGDEADNIFANVKINYGKILSIDEKVNKYHQ